MFSTIVVGIDGSKNADRALQAAIDLAKRTPDPSLHVVMAHLPLSERDIQAIAADLPEEMRPLLHADMESETVFAKAMSMVRGGGVDAEFHEISDDPTDALLAAIDRVGADLVVVGSRGEGIAKRVMHGSVSTKVLHHAPCSVLVIKADG